MCVDSPNESLSISRLFLGIVPPSLGSTGREEPSELNDNRFERRSSSNFHQKEKKAPSRLDKKPAESKPKAVPPPGKKHQIDSVAMIFFVFRYSSTAFDPNKSKKFSIFLTFDSKLCRFRNRLCRYGSNRKRGECGNRCKSFRYAQW